MTLPSMRMSFSSLSKSGQWTPGSLPHAQEEPHDRLFPLVTSANFSWSAEHGNVGFVVLIDNRNLTKTVERQLLHRTVP
jgi:hypothetical protein